MLQTFTRSGEARTGGDLAAGAFRGMLATAQGSVAIWSGDMLQVTARPGKLSSPQIRVVVYFLLPSSQPAKPKPMFSSMHLPLRLSLYCFTFAMLSLGATEYVS